MSDQPQDLFRKAVRSKDVALIRSTFETLAALPPIRVPRAALFALRNREEALGATGNLALRKEAAADSLIHDLPPHWR